MKKRYQSLRESKSKRKWLWNWRETPLLKSCLSVKMMVCSVVSEQIPLPAASASLRKIAVECTESSSNGSIDTKGEIAEGWRLLSMDSSKNLQEGFIQIRHVLPVR